MSLDTLVQVNIDRQTRTPTRTGFGTPLIFAQDWHLTNLIKTYNTATVVADLLADGFASDSPVVLKAQAIASQDPRPPQLKVARRDPVKHTGTLEPLVTDEDFVYSFQVRVLPGAGFTTITYTNGPAETAATIATALAALFDAVAGIDASSLATEVLIETTDDDKIFQIIPANDLIKLNGVIFQDTTPAPAGFLDDLNLVRQIDDDWYGIVVDRLSRLEANELAPIIEAAEKLLCFYNSDFASGFQPFPDVFDDLKALALDKTFGIFRPSPLGFGTPDAAWMGKQLPTDPGTTTWAYKTLKGEVAQVLGASIVSEVEESNGNVYMTVAGVNITFDGRVASGEYIDVIRFIDWLKARLQERIFTLLINNPKVPYTDAGIDLVKGEIENVLQIGVRRGALSNSPPPVVTVPQVIDIDTADKAARFLPDVTFQAVLAGAIHKVAINGRITL